MTTRWERFQQEVVHGNVVLNFTSFPKGDLGVYAHAYQQAANSLVKEFRGKPYYSDAEACPIVFLYRHSVELYLKQIVLWGAGLVHLQTSDALDVHGLFSRHEFKLLLSHVRKVFEVAGWLNSSECAPKYGTFAEIESVIMEFDKIDPQSFAFRYPIDKKGDAPLPEHFHFNVVKLGEEMDQLLRMLDGAATGVYEQFQFLAREYHSMR
jgi:hypothetical protein